MAKFVLSAFADEYSPEIDKQIEGLKANGIGMLEIRGVDGTNIADISEEKAREVKAKFDANGIKVSCIGSPIGKIKISDPFEPHLEKLRHVIKLAKIFGTKKIRMFSFYPDNNEQKMSDIRDEVMKRLSAMLEIAEAEDVLLCHENERGIYGDSVERCLEIQKEFGGRIKCVFDPANFICMGDEPYPYGYKTLKDYILYFHIKDAYGEARIVPTGEGYGRIPEMLADVDRDFDGEVILTLEPHLTVFKGLAVLEHKKEGEIIKEYSSGEEAFKVAADALKKYIRL